jgi:flagellar basal-body rod protein FlgB
MELFDNVHLALERALQGSAMRHTALAENLANINTPGYRRRDVDFHSALQAALPGGKEALASATLQVTTDPSAPMRADGNSVDIDAESANLAQNGLEYQALTQVLKTRDDILRSAMGLG